MKYAVVYESKTGNTEYLANTIKEIGNGKEIYFGSPTKEAKQADLIFVGFWTDKGTCSENIADFLKELHHKQVFLFGTAGFGGEQTYFNRILGTVQRHLSKDNALLGSYMCQGKMPMVVRQRYEEMLPQNANMRSMIANFDEALLHPNSDDIMALQDKIKQIITDEE